MRSHKAEIKVYLKSFPEARERKNRYKVLRRLLTIKYPSLRDTVLTKEKLEDVIFDALSYNRSILKVQQDYEGLRGADYYENKRILEQQAKIDLGYVPGIGQDIKKLRTLYG